MPDAKVGFQLRYNYFNEHQKCEISAHKKKNYCIDSYTLQTVFSLSIYTTRFCVKYINQNIARYDYYL